MGVGRGLEGVGVGLRQQRWIARSHSQWTVRAIRKDNGGIDRGVGVGR